MTDLSDYLAKLPKQYNYAIEVRHKSWLTQEFISLLRENGVALVTTEKSITEFEATADFLYIRWEGDRKSVNGQKGEIEVDKAEDLQTWADKLRPRLNKGLKVFGYFGKYYSGLPPSDVQILWKNICQV